MKPLTISVASAAILAAASFGAHAQGQAPQEQPGASRSAPSQGGGAETRGSGGAGTTGQAERSTQPSAEKPAAGREAQGSDRPAAGGSDRPSRADSGDKPDQKNAADKAGDKSDQKAADKAGDKSDQKAADKAGDSTSKDAKSADKADGGKSGKQARVEIKPEQKTVIKQTIVKENIRPQKIDVQIRVGATIPRTVVLHPLPPAIIEVYPSYRSYKLVMVDDNTILVIDPVDWEIVDVIEV
jgi:hypothetical protein